MNEYTQVVENRINYLRASTKGYDVGEEKLAAVKTELIDIAKECERLTNLAIDSTAEIRMIP